MIGMRGGKKVWGGEVTREMLARSFSGEVYIGNRELIPRDHEIGECLSVDAAWDRIDWCVLKNGVVHGVLILTGRSVMVYVPIEKWRYWPVEYPVPLDVKRFNHETCKICGQKALYRQGEYGYCRDHKTEAVRARTRSFLQYEKAQDGRAELERGFMIRSEIKDRLHKMKKRQKS